MHDLGVRVVSTLLLSGVLLFAAFFLYSILYPRRAAATSPSEAAPTVSSRPKDYGYLAPVARPIEWTLRRVEARVTRRTGRSSWGWAIVLTTFLMNLALLPFRILAERNAKVMKALQPQIDAINARYRGKGLPPAEQSRAISEVYKRHKTSPLAGCIPSLASLAVLAAFYSVLTGIAELHGAPWLWVADLARPERLPVRILPVLMIATQLLLAKITPSPAGADPRIARLMTILPLVFGIVLYRQPSALMLYWLTSNLLQLAQQWWLARRCASPNR